MLKKYRFFIVVVVISIGMLVPAFSRYQELREKNINVEASIRKLAVANKALYEKQRKMQTDPVYAELVARRNLGVAKEGEVIFKIFPKENK